MPIAHDVTILLAICAGMWLAACISTAIACGDTEKSNKWNLIQIATAAVENDTYDTYDAHIIFYVANNGTYSTNRIYPYLILRCICNFTVDARYR